MLWHSNLLRDAQERIIGTLASAEDITERKAMELALQESEERLRVTLEITQVGVWDWNLENDHWYASPTYFTMLGYRPVNGPADRTEWLERLHPEDRSRVAGRISSVLDGTGTAYEYEARIRHADGSYRWHQVRGHAVKADAAGRPVRMVGIRMDITERKRAEDELRWKSAFLEAEINSSLD